MIYDHNKYVKVLFRYFIIVYRSLHIYFSVGGIMCAKIKFPHPRQKGKYIQLIIIMNTDIYIQLSILIYVLLQIFVL